MANTLTGLLPIFYEALDTVANEKVGFLTSVQQDANADQVTLGQPIRSFVTPAVTPTDIAPGVTAPNTGGQALTYVDLLITKSQAVPVQWTGEEQLSVKAQLANIFRDQVAQAFRGLRNAMEADIAAAAIAGAAATTGTAGTTPFGVAGDLSDGAALQKLLDDAGAPDTDRHLVVNSATMKNFRGKQSVLFKVNESGTADLLRKGIIGELQGMNIHTSSALNTSADNILFHKNAIVLATRVPAMPAGGDAATDVTEILDPVSGITYQIAMYKMYRQIHIEIGAAWGVKVIKSAFVANLLG